MDNTIVKNMTSQSIDKTAIKTFAIYARNKLINDIKNKAAMIGVTESGIQKPLPTSTGNLQLFDIGMQEPYRIEGKAIEQRKELIIELEKRTQGSNYLTAYETLIEEVAYTWFNRIIAIRFMEVNNYMPDRMRVLSSGVEGINEPEFVTHVFESSFEFSAKEKESIIELKTDGSNLAMDELFQYLFIKQCNALNSNLPELFEKTNDYTELLLSVSYNDVEGVIYKLVHDVPEANFDVNSDNGNGQVEIIGWMYQFYNTEPKATVFGRPKSKKIEKQDIPAATQLFTPEWIVKYMVENSLGRLWIEKLLANGDTRTEKQIGNDFGWEYYLPEADQDESVRKQLKILRKERKNLSIEDIRFLDPAMGSFHIGIYAFDVYMQLYESEGYTTREAAKLIVEKNLYGLEIDKRATQLSYFASMMQARKYNRRILKEDLQPNVYEIPESNYINREHLNYLGNDIENKEEWDRLNLQLVSLLNNFIDAKEYGSLMNISDDYDFSLLRKFVLSHPVDSQLSLLETVGLEDTQIELINIINVAETMSRKYDVVITNPPYMSSSGMDKKLSDFAKKYYSNSKFDMFAMFIEKCRDYTVENGYFSMITQHVWMFISSYEKLRSSLLKNTIVNMAHLGTRAFEEIGGEVVQTTSFVFLNNTLSNYCGKYIKLTEFESQSKKEVAYLNTFNNKDSTYVYDHIQENFFRIPGSPIAYWVSLEFINIFSNRNIGYYAIPKAGIVTGNDPYFVRFWHEVNLKEISFSESFPYKKYHLMQKGGTYRRYEGNSQYIIKLKDLFDETKTNKSVRRGDPKFYFKKGIGWSQIGSNYNKSFRLIDNSVCGTATPTIYLKNDKFYYYILGLLNSPISNDVMNILNPTINLLTSDICKVPVIINDNYLPRINFLVQENIRFAKSDWNSIETSWNFKRHSLLEGLLLTDHPNPSIYNCETSLKTIYEKYKNYTNSIFSKMKKNEEELNKIFIELYGLENDLDYKVKDKDISISRIYDSKEKIHDSMMGNQYILTPNDIIKSLISYVVGCLFGRYSLVEDGIIFAGGEFNKFKYNDFSPSEDNVVFIAEEGYFSENIVSRFEEFLRVIYGNEALEENLNFIASALGKKGNSSREVIRNYFLNDFYKDHLKTYQKRPIYWLYDSGKQNGFKALVYMHRYDEDTTGKVRVDYLHPVQRAYERTIVNLQDDIANSKDAKESTQLQKQLEKVTKQLKECRDYDERLGHMALERVAIDLDDGVKVNYDKIQTDSKGKFHQILAKIK